MPRSARPGGILVLPRDYRQIESRSVRFVATATGQGFEIRLPHGEMLSHASPAPWVDALGGSQVVGRWTRHRGEGNQRVIESFGLARIEIPSGVVLDRVETRVLPSSAPCWLSGGKSRVVFPSSNGRLYRLDFEPTGSDGLSIGDEDPAGRAPIRMDWKAENPSDRELFIYDIVRPESARLSASGLLIASARLRGERAADGGGSPARLWWLRLDSTGTAVIDAGPLDSAGGEDDTEHRFPALAEGSQGPTLAYLSRSLGTCGWQLHITRLNFEHDGVTPLAMNSTGPVVFAQFDGPSLAFSPDGNHLYAVSRDAEGSRTVRLPIAPNASERGAAAGF